MKKKNKMIAIAIAASVAIGTYSMSGESEDVNLAPKGFSYSESGHLVPDINVKMIAKGVPSLLNAMHKDKKGELASYAIGYQYLISSLKVKEQVLNKRPYVEYVSSDKETIKLQPRGLHVGIQYSGKSNFNRQVYDEVAFGFLSEWTNTSSSIKVSNSVFGDLVSKDIGFPLAILYFQRQFLEQTEIKGFSGKTSGYKPIFAEYSYLYGEHIAKKIPFKTDTLDNLKETISNNIVAITKYLSEQEANGDPRINEKAVFLLEFYLNEDMKMLKSLERDLRMISPPDNSNKEQMRIHRLEEEMRNKQKYIIEQEKADRKNQRLVPTIR